MSDHSSREGLVMRCIGTFVGALIGGILGVCGGFFLPEPILSLVNPQEVRYGQIGGILRNTIPGGFALGAFAGGLTGFFLTKSRP